MFFLKELPGKAILEQYARKYPDMDVEKTDRALHMMRSASLLIRDLEAYFATHDLSQTKFLTLIVLEREPDKPHLTLTEICHRLDVSKTVISKTLKTLEKQGAIKIRQNIEDQRSKHIQITEKGRKKIESLMPGYYQLINKHIEENESYEHK